MQPTDKLLKSGIRSLPTMGDGRQSGTSGSPSILHVTPESAIGGNLALLQTNDIVRVDIPARRVDVLLGDEELVARRESWVPEPLENQTPWQQIYRNNVGPLSTGACFDFAVEYAAAGDKIPRHNH